MNTILAIDPGTTHSAYTIYNPNTETIVEAAKVENDALMYKVFDANRALTDLVIEEIKSYGMPMGQSTIDTCYWIGRFIQAWGAPYTFLPRKTIVTHICGSSRAKDSNVRSALISRFSGRRDVGGGKEPAIGTKPKPGPLYGFNADMWSSLAIAITYAEQERERTNALLR